MVVESKTDVDLSTSPIWFRKAVARDGGSVGTGSVGGVGNGGACVGGIDGACGAGGVCDGGVAGCFARGVCGGVAGGPSCFSSMISAMVVESKPDVEQPTAPFWSRYVNFEPLFVWRQPLQPPAVYSPRPQCVARSRSSPLVQPRAVRRVGDGGASGVGSGSACGACGVFDSGVAGCFACDVCGGVAGGPSCFSSTISAMVVESKSDVEQPTAPFWIRYVNFEPYSFGASHCIRPLSTAHGRNASLALGACLSCSHVLFGGLRPFPSLLLPTVLGCLAPLALVAAPLTREAAASTAARNGSISVGASGVGDVW